MKSPHFIALAAAILTCSSTLADTYTVTNISDSGPGSLRQAILDANKHANVNNTPDGIAFNIAGAGIHTITPLSQLPDVTDPVTIDGFSQPGTIANSAPVTQPMNAALKVELNGNNVPSSSSLPSSGLYITAGGSTVQGLVINRFITQVTLRGDGGSNGNTNRVQGCYLGTDPTGKSAPVNTQTNAPGEAGLEIRFSTANLIGATFNSGRNLISGGKANIEISDAGGNTIAGNLIGLAADGATAVVSSGYGIFLNGASANVIGGTTSAARNVISGNGSGGIALYGKDTTIQGNFIGTDITGTRAVGNDIGLTIGAASTIGGSAAGAGNLISGNLSDGIELDGDSNFVEGNLIGTDVTGKQPLGNGGHGMTIVGGNGNFIGGTTAGEGNVIAFNHHFGVYIGSSPAGIGNNIRGNSIFRNDQLGIGLGTLLSAPTPNDQNDGDSGGNGRQNYPIVTLATISGSKLNLAGNLNSTPNTGFRIDLYADAGADASGYGEARFYLGTALASTNQFGDTLFNLTVPYIPETTVVTATATANDGTSEFSKALPITGASSHLLNISTRLNVQTGDNVLISGFIISGQENKRIIIRGLGPSLKVNGQMNNPALELYSGSGLFGSNDDWHSSQGPEIQATGIPPSDAREAAGVVALAPGAYSAILRGSGGDTGIALLDAYDLDQAALCKFANVSTRGFVGTGDDVLIGGVIVGGAGNAGAKVIFRAIGPSIAGVANPLQDPMLELYNSNGVLFAANDDWKSEEAATQATGIPPSDTREAALVRSLSPGNYTALVRGKNGGTGVALVEAYNLP